MTAPSRPDWNGEDWIVQPPSSPAWSGQNWYLTAGGYWPTVAVIERPSESYDAHHERRKREEGARRVPFGFARALLELEETDG